MLNSDAIVICHECGFEFVSIVVVAQTAIGCSEVCHRCRNAIESPTLVGGINTAVFGAKPPMIRDYGEHGYVYLGAGLTETVVQDRDLVPIRAAYSRNINRVLALLDLAELATKDKVPKISMPALLASALILARTSYEILIADLFQVLSGRLEPSLAQPEKAIEKENKLFKIVNAEQKFENFKAHRAAIKYVSIVRNALTHAGGFVDHKFIADYSRLKEEQPGNWPAYREGDVLGFDLSVVTSLCDSVQQISHFALRAAQELLNPAK